MEKKCGKKKNYLKKIGVNVRQSLLDVFFYKKRQKLVPLVVHISIQTPEERTGRLFRVWESPLKKKKNKSWDWRSSSVTVTIAIKTTFGCSIHGSLVRAGNQLRNRRKSQNPAISSPPNLGCWWDSQLTVGTWFKLYSLALSRRLAMLLAMFIPWDVLVLEQVGG